jgi:hypothetical protein
MVHLHGRVDRFTATMMVVKYLYRRRANEERIEGQRRYQTGPGLGREVGASDYGGSYVHSTCQRRPKRES